MYGILALSVSITAEALPVLVMNLPVQMYAPGGEFPLFAALGRVRKPATGVACSRTRFASGERIFCSCSLLDLLDGRYKLMGGTLRKQRSGLLSNGYLPMPNGPRNWD